MTKPGKRSPVTGRIQVRWSEFARWMERYHYVPSRDRYDPALDVDRIVEEVQS